MRNYWLRIVLGAAAVFGLGLLIVNAFRSGARKIERLGETSDPINIPLALIPFTVDGVERGTFRGLRVERSTPHDVSRVVFSVKADAAAPELPADCILSVRDPDKIDTKDSFRCYTAADTAGIGEEVIGEVKFVADGRTFTLIAPKGALADIDLNFGDGARVAAEAASDSAVAAAADSAAAAATAAAESAGAAEAAAKSGASVTPSGPPAAPSPAPSAPR